MGYGDSDGKLSVSVQEIVPLTPGGPSGKEVVVKSSDTTQFGIVIRLLNAHKVKYKVQGDAIFVPIAEEA